MTKEEQRKKHNLYCVQHRKDNPLKYIFSGMKRRCEGKAKHNKHLYENVSVKFVDEKDFVTKMEKSYLEKVASNPGVKITIDRYPDPHGDYSVDNCRWATPKEQANNLRTNVYITHKGVRKTQTEWALEANLTPEGLHARLKRGMSMEEALNKPKPPNKFLTYKGNTHTQAEWERILGLKKGLIFSRLSRGVSVEKALTR